LSDGIDQNVGVEEDISGHWRRRDRRRILEVKDVAVCGAEPELVLGFDRD